MTDVPFMVWSCPAGCRADVAWNHDHSDAQCKACGRKKSFGPMIQSVPGYEYIASVAVGEFHIKSEKDMDRTGVFLLRKGDRGGGRMTCEFHCHGSDHRLKALRIIDGEVNYWRDR